MEEVVTTASVERMLKRAADRQAKRAQKRVEDAFKRNPFKGLGRTTESAFANALSKALRSHGSRNRGRRESVRMTAPDTGGRPFHFDHTAVSKKSIALKQGETVPATNTYGKRKKEFARPTSHTTMSGAHMAYIERDGAAEEFDLDRELDAAMGRGGRERTPGGMQVYLEDDEKLAANDRAAGGGKSPSREVAFSFGTPEMGETLEERIAFWGLAEKHAERENGTTQHRLVVELPHECSAKDRLDIMRTFTAKYERDRVPYWCVLHAPVEGENDDRNFHAHIVLLNRPAWKEPFPEGGKDFRRPDGPLVDTWTFAATEEIRDKHDNYLKRYPLRSNVLDDYRGKFVADERKRFAHTVNAQMGASGVPVRYDHRSYKAMGLPVEAMKSIKGMILEKSKAGKRLVLDTGQTKRLVDLEIERISRKHQVDLSEVERIKRAVRASTSRLTQLDREARSLGRKGLVRHASHALRRDYAQAALRYALAKQAHVKREIELRLDADNLRRCVEATDQREIAPLRKKLEKDLKAALQADQAAAAREAADPKRKTAPEGEGKVPRKTERAVATLQSQIDALPDPEIVSLLHAEAVAELKRVEREHAQALAQSEGRMRSALRAWGLVAARPAPVELPHLTEHAAAPPAPSYVPKTEPKTEKSLYRYYPESAHDMIAAMFNTPHARIALELNNRIVDHIQEAAKIKVPGRTTVEIVMDEVKALTEAFKQGRDQAELTLRHGPRDRTSFTGIPTGGVAIARAQRDAALAKSMAPSERNTSTTLEVTRERGREEPSAQPGGSKEPPVAAIFPSCPESGVLVDEGLIKDQRENRRRQRRRRIPVRRSDVGRG